MENRIGHTKEVLYKTFLTLLIPVALGLSGCGSSGKNSPRGESALAAAAPVTEAQPTATMPQAWEFRCAVDITVVEGDMVDFSITQRAQEICPELNSSDVHNSWYFQFGPDRKMDTIQPDEVLRLKDYVDR